jgi:hypothetical protein
MILLFAVNNKNNLPVIIHLAVNKLLKNFSRLKKPHTKHRRCKCIRRLRIQRAVVPSLKAKKKKASHKAAKSQRHKEESISQRTQKTQKFII